MKQDVLFLSHRMPFPPDRGDKIRAHHVLRRLAALAPVHVATFADDERDMAEEVELAAITRSYRLVRRVKPLIVAGMQGLWSRYPVSRLAYASAEISGYVADVLTRHEIATIYVGSVQMAQYVPGGFAGRVIADFVDVASAKYEAYAARHTGFHARFERREAALLRAEEQRLALRADVNLLVSPEEAALFSQRLAPEARPHCDVRVMRNGANAAYFDPAKVIPSPQVLAAGKPRLIFAGQMDHAPNVAAVTRVVSSIMPKIRETLPEATFHVVGRSPSLEVKALDGLNGCRVWGGVGDVRPYLAAADLALIASSIGRGVQNKVLEAMAMALPVVMTPEAAAGIDGVEGVHFAIAADDAALAERSIALLTHPRLGWSTGLEARRFVAEKLSWSGALSNLAEFAGRSVVGMNRDCGTVEDGALVGA